MMIDFYVVGRGSNYLWFGGSSIAVVVSANALCCVFVLRVCDLFHIYYCMWYVTYYTFPGPMMQKMLCLKLTVIYGLTRV